MPLCCQDRKKAAPRINQHGDPVVHSIDDALSGHEDEVEEVGWFGGLTDFLELEADSSGSDCETEDNPGTFQRAWGYGVSAEVIGPNNPLRAHEPPVHAKTPEQRRILQSAFEQANIFKRLDPADLGPIVDAVAIETFQGNDRICQQGDSGDAFLVILSGAVDLYKSNTGSAEPGMESAEFVRTLKEPGTLIGELALLWNMQRSLTVKANSQEPCTIGRLDREVYRHLVIINEINQREEQQQALRKVKLLETMDDEQIAKLADALRPRVYNQGDHLITQGDDGAEFFILVRGECVATVATYFLGIMFDEQEHRRYHAGDLFGERAILTNEPRAATITACEDGVRALTMSRGKFERLLGPLAGLQDVQYLSDPRKLIADFYLRGDGRGPAGSLVLNDKDAATQAPKDSDHSHWFVVYRPTSRDAIAKMLSGAAVGKGLNVKGKSAKKGVLSGFVPFLQISDNDHKSKVEASPSDSRVSLYLRSSSARDEALAALYGVLHEAGGRLQIDDKKIKMLDDYAPNLYGLDLPEPLLKEAYIMQPNIVPRVGWEPGRASEPAFMDMNLHAVRDASSPKVVLYQFDEGDPMNPRGLLIAYAEKLCKPVVSDFDTFTVGSRGMNYEPLPSNQAQMAKQSLLHARPLIETPSGDGWTGRWLQILKQEAEKGIHPSFPKYGFGDPTSYRLIGDVVGATLSCGAVRHGAECFNFYFPQELDDEYLVIWDGFPDSSWAYLKEPELREFLIERIREDYVFPLNPVWPIRDSGWYEVLEAMRSNPKTASSLDVWDPAGAGIMDLIDDIHKSCPDGFSVKSTESGKAFGGDATGCEMADLATEQVSKMMRLKSAVNQVKAMNALNKGPTFQGKNNNVAE